MRDMLLELLTALQDLVTPTEAVTENNSNVRAVEIPETPVTKKRSVKK